MNKKSDQKQMHPIAFAALLVVITTLALIAVPALKSIGIVLKSSFEEFWQSPPTASMPVAVTDTITPTIKPIYTPSKAPTITPTWEIILTIPPDFKVGTWHNENFECKVDINGVEIFGGVPPYTIVFTQDDQVNTRVSPIEGRVEFLAPVTVWKGETVYVVISYHTKSQEIRLRKELLYPQASANPICIH